MAVVHLHGRLKRFGGPYTLDVTSASEAFRALSVNLPGFEKELVKGSYRVIRGQRKAGLDLGLDTLNLGLGRSTPLHLVPVRAGAGGGRGKAILGVAIAGLAIGVSGGTAAGLATPAFSALGTTVSWGNIALFGITMALTGVSQMLSKQPAQAASEPVDRRQSFLFTSPVNVTEQGNVVPVVYGLFRTGSVVISASLDTERVDGGSSGTNAGTSLTTTLSPPPSHVDTAVWSSSGLVPATTYPNVTHFKIVEATNCEVRDGTGTIHVVGALVPAANVTNGFSVRGFHTTQATLAIQAVQADGGTVGPIASQPITIGYSGGYETGGNN